MMFRSQLILLGAIGASLLCSLGSSRMDPYFLDVTITVGINIILAVSLNLINGYTGQFSLGHAGFMAVGAYSAATLTTNFGPALLPLAGGQTWILFPVALLAGGLMAALAACSSACRLRLKGDYLAIVTLGFADHKVSKCGCRAGPGHGGAPPTEPVLTFSVAADDLCRVGAHPTKYGRAIAVSDDEVAAQAMGINTTRYKITAFVVGAFSRGSPGHLRALQTVHHPSGFDFNKSIGSGHRHPRRMGRQVGVIRRHVVGGVAGGAAGMCRAGCGIHPGASYHGDAFPSEKGVQCVEPDRRRTDDTLFGVADRADADAAAGLFSMRAVVEKERGEGADRRRGFE
jgi:branched-chain amino acid transport system permease protein